MPIRDALHTFGTDQSLAGGQSAPATDLLNWGESPVRKGGHPRPLWIEVAITESFTSAQANTLAIQVQSCATEGGTYKTALQTFEIPKAAALAGKVVRIPFPMTGCSATDTIKEDGLMQFVRVYYVQGGSSTNWTAGKVSAYLIGG